MNTTAVQHSQTDTSLIGLAGIACLIAGLLGAATSVYLVFRLPLVGEDMWTYPQRAGGEFATTQTIFALVHIGMILGLLALWWCGAVPATRLGRVGQVLAVAGMVGLTINELLAIGPAGQANDSAAAGTIGAIYGVVTTMIALGMIIAGIAVVREGVWRGWQRWLPLVMGIWLFIPTMPALFLEGDVARIALGIWALLFSVLGLVHWRTAAARRTWSTQAPGRNSKLHESPDMELEDGADRRLAHLAPASRPAGMSSFSGGLIAVGALGGLAWAASLRGWMIQIAGEESSFGWLGTFVLILLPGAVLGALLGWAAYMQMIGDPNRRRQRRLMASPLLLAAPLLDPRIFEMLIRNGQGGGALGVAVIGVTGGYALSRRGSLTSTVSSGLVALLLIVACGSIGMENTPLTTPHGAWIATQVVSLLGVLCVACSIPYRMIRAQE